jgi:hypothetical protein
VSLISGFCGPDFLRLRFRRRRTTSRLRKLGSLDKKIPEKNGARLSPRRSHLGEEEKESSSPNKKS